MKFRILCKNTVLWLIGCDVGPTMSSYRRGLEVNSLGINVVSTASHSEKYDLLMSMCVIIFIFQIPKTENIVNEIIVKTRNNRPIADAFYVPRLVCARLRHDNSFSVYKMMLIPW